MSTEPTHLDGAGESSVDSYLTPTVDFLLIVTCTILVSAAAVALMVP